MIVCDNESTPAAWSTTYPLVKFVSISETSVPDPAAKVSMAPLPVVRANVIVIPPLVELRVRLELAAKDR